MGVYLGANLITPEYEYQEKHHLFFGEPEEERRTNRGECACPYACDICQLENIKSIDPLLYS